MRIDARERRFWIRRLGARLAPFIKSKILKAPLVVVVYITIYLNPTVLADVQSQPSSPVHVQAIHEKVEENKLDDKDTSDFVPVRTLGDKISEQLSALLQNMSHRGTPLTELRKGSANFDTEANKPIPAERLAEDDIMKMGAFATVEPKHSDPKLVTDHFKNDSSAAATDMALSQVETWQKFKNGFDFKLDFKKFFAKKSSSDKIPTTKGKVRYGLILKEIVPEKNSKLALAAIESDMRYAGHADVKWTIGPISEDGSEKPFASMESYDDLAAEGQEKTFMEKITPTPSFDTNIKFADTDSAGYIRQGKTPAMRLTIRQEQGLYELMVDSQNEQFKRRAMEHQFNVPVVENMSFGRRYNDKMEVIKTSVNNILVDKRAPSLSVHYLHLQERYVAEAAYANAKKAYSVGVKGTTEGNEKTPEAERAEKYEVTFNKNI